MRISAELVKIHLLVEIRVRFGPLIALWIARVIEAGAIGLPVDAASCGSEVDTRNAVRKFLSRGNFEDAS